MALAAPNQLIKINEIVVSEMRGDGYVDATRLCQSVGKRVNNYLRTQRTKEFLDALARSTHIRADLLVETVETGTNADRGTWVHPRVATNLAQWLSPEFEVAVSDLVLRHLTGRAERVVRYELPPADVRISNLANAMSALGIQATNPRFAQAIQDHAANILLLPSNVAPEERWRGVVEVAEEMGYRQALRDTVRSALGRHVSRHVEELERTREQRLCCGTMRPVYVYKDTPALRRVISSYFEDDSEDGVASSEI